MLLRFINVFYLISRKRRETYFEANNQSQRSHAQHLQLYRAIAAQDVEAGQKLLRRHIKGVDAYFRMFFAEAHGAQPPAPVPKAERPAASPARRVPVPVKGKVAKKVALQRSLVKAR